MQATEKNNTTSTSNSYTPMMQQHSSSTVQSQPQVTAGSNGHSMTSHAQHLQNMQQHSQASAQYPSSRMMGEYPHHYMHTAPEIDLERKKFMDTLHAVIQESGKSITKMPVMGYRELDLYRFYMEVQSYGGYAQVTEKVGTWSKIWKKLGNFDTSITDASFRLKKNYERFLLEFEYREHPERRRENHTLARTRNERKRRPNSPTKQKTVITGPTTSISMPTRDSASAINKRQRVMSCDAILDHPRMTSSGANSIVANTVSRISSTGNINGGNMPQAAIKPTASMLSSSDPGAQLLSASSGPLSSPPSQSCMMAAQKPGGQSSTPSSPASLRQQQGNFHFNAPFTRTVSSPHIFHHSSSSAPSRMLHPTSASSPSMGPFPFAHPSMMHHVVSSDSLLSLSPPTEQLLSPIDFFPSPTSNDNLIMGHSAVSNISSISSDGILETVFYPEDWNQMLENMESSSELVSDPASEMSIASEDSIDGNVPQLPGNWYWEFSDHM